jgi:alpha-beta hydrolase superfamily lysophospholipase
MTITRRRLLFRTSALLMAGLVRPCPLWAAVDEPPACEPFFVGSHELLRDPSLNFQLNRWIAYGGLAVLQDIQRILPRLVSLDAWRTEFSAASDQAMAAGHMREAAIFARSAEFFMVSSDRRKGPLRERFVTLMRRAYGVAEPERVRFAGGYLPYYRFTPWTPRDAVILFGGFDSYIEEFLPILLALHHRGFDVIAFDGPGQGGALEDSGLPMTPDWERPLSAILGGLSVSDAILVGLSLGGCLAIRAASREPRVSRVVAWDALTDFQEIFLRQIPPAGQLALRLLLGAGADGIVDALASRGSHPPIQEWGMTQAMHVFGVDSPAAALRATASYRTADVSPLVRQDVLLLAGSEDHYVPHQQIYDQASWLANARSVTTRMFTRAENAQAHCQIGNLPLAIATIAAWIDRRDVPAAAPGPTPESRPRCLD